MQWKKGSPSLLSPPWEEDWQEEECRFRKSRLQTVFVLRLWTLATLPEMMQSWWTRSAARQRLLAAFQTATQPRSNLWSALHEPPECQISSISVPDKIKGISCPTHPQALFLECPFVLPHFLLIRLGLQYLVLIIKFKMKHQKHFYFDEQNSFNLLTIVCLLLLSSSVS